MITIIDYGVGNLRSILNILKYINIDAEVANDIYSIEKASKLILPGVGAFDTAVQALESKPGFKDIIIR